VKVINFVKTAEVMGQSVAEVSLEEYFNTFRKNVIGQQESFAGPYGRKNIVYADWTASGRLYQPIEERLSNEIGPFVGNTHTETSETGMLMTQAYHEAREIIKKHVNAGPSDVMINEGSGMTGVVNKLQRILGLKIPEKFANDVKIPDDERPVVFISHMEHHSNHTSWLETCADIECIMPNEKGLINLDHFREILHKYRNRSTKIASITACSNVTGIQTCYQEIARIMHQHGGYIFVDFAASAPYVNIDMHPPDPLEKLDAIYFSPHKFLGGPGTPGVLVFDKSLYTNKVPDQPGGGTVWWTNPWGGRHYFEDIEAREDGGTPPFMQTMKAALAVRLKEQMNPELMLQREHEIMKRLFDGTRSIPNLNILAGDIEERLGIFSFYIDDMHFDLVTRLMNDRFGVQVRGGCSCAGTYGHYLLHIDENVSRSITDKIDQGDLTFKPGWVRLSIHPVVTNEEVDLMIEALQQVALNGKSWADDYVYDQKGNTYVHKKQPKGVNPKVTNWFEL